MISSNDQNQGCLSIFPIFQYLRFSVFRSTKLINEQLHLFLRWNGRLASRGTWSKSNLVCGFWFGRVTLLESRLIWIALSADQRTDTRKKISRCSSKSCINHACYWFYIFLIVFVKKNLQVTLEFDTSAKLKKLWRHHNVMMTSSWKRLNVRVNITDGLELRFQFIGSSWLNSPIDWVIYQMYWQR